MSDSKGAHRRRNHAAGSKKTSATAKSGEAKAQHHMCQEPGCGKVCRSAGGLKSHVRSAHPVPVVLDESPTAAAERFLSSIDITPRLALPAAQVRQLAKALEECELTDKAKTSKELTALLRDLLSGGAVVKDEPDWTGDDDS